MSRPMATPKGESGLPGWFITLVFIIIVIGGSLMMGATEMVP